MIRSGLGTAIALVAVIVPGRLFAGDADPGVGEIRAAIARSIPLLERASAGSAEERTCFTCHNQTLPVLALVAARDRGFTVDAANLTRQLDHTAAHLSRGKEGYLKGQGQGGKVITAGYALWALEAGGHPANETTAAVTEYLLQYQQDQNRWSHPGSRPPSSGSDFTTTFVALRGLNSYGTPEQQPRIASRIETIRDWLLTDSPVDTEDRVFRLRALHEIGVDKEIIAGGGRELLEQQRADGGWAQNSSLQSDPYATATVLAALFDTDAISNDVPAARAAARYLLDSQLEDGSWHVASRAKPFQTYFETGYPHGKDQFISVAAGSWATVVLVKMLPPRQ